MGSNFGLRVHPLIIIMLIRVCIRSLFFQSISVQITGAQVQTIRKRIRASVIRFWVQASKSTWCLNCGRGQGLAVQKVMLDGFRVVTSPPEI